MGPLVRKHLAVGVMVGVWALALALPSASRAQDSLEKLRQALKEPELKASTQNLTEAEYEKIEDATKKFETISERRRAYFLREWSRYAIVGPKILGKIGEIRNRLGVNLRDAIAEASAKAAKGPHIDIEAQLAVGILIAEIAETEYTTDAKTKKEKRGVNNLTHDAEMTLSRSLGSVVKGLAESKDIRVRQAGLNALGKITPDPITATKIIKGNLTSGELGPRRLAAYALVDLAKKANHHKSEEELPLLKNVIDTAVDGFGNADELTRGYCLQAIQESALAVMEGFKPTRDNKLKKDLSKAQHAVLDAYRKANPALVNALADSSIHIRLAALEALDEMSAARTKIMESYKLDPDPLADIISTDWRTIAGLLKEENPSYTREDRIRLRRGAIAFFEQLGADAALAEPEIADALRDEDRFVKWAAMRTIRNIRATVTPKAIQALAFNLLVDNDADLSAAAADALEAIGPKAREAVPALGLVIRNAGANNRGWDVENRLKAMKALVSIGSPAAHLALPELLSALSDTEVRVRRAAAESIGQIARPDDDAEMLKSLNTALRKSLRDDDSEVRLNASEAILSLRRK